ncbi:MAG: BACON domain-containing protein [Bacteroidales bacterium]|nr:BACON domain-containing protein [Bacteroidales bacterium]
MDCRKLFRFGAAAILAAALTACQKDYSIIDDLGVLQHTLKVSCDPGNTHITVYADGAWTVALEKPTEWASLNKLSGEGLGDFMVSWSANFGVARGVNIIIRSDGKEEVVRVIQAGAITSPYINLTTSRVVLPGDSHDFEIPMTTNLGFCLDEFRAKAVYFTEGKEVPDTLEVGGGASGAWVTAYKISSDKVEFSVSANDSAADRVADVIFYMTDAAGQENHAIVSLMQTASGPVFNLTEQSKHYYANADSYLVETSANNIWSLPDVSASSDASWISSIEVTEEGLSFVTQENMTGAPRSATIRVSCEGLASDTVLYVDQAAEKLLSFEELRRGAAGVLSTTDKLEGIVISDPSSPNICSSPQTGQFAFDRSENDRTAYLESIDGNYGICLKFSSKEENVFNRGDRLLIDLDGATLLRENNPVRFTLSELVKDQIEVLETNVEIPVKEKTIPQLADTDIYTWVSIPGIEILFKDGCYTNASEGYCMADDLNPLGAAEPRWDVAPLMCTDASGQTIFMLTNAAAPWRRTGTDVAWYSALPQGAGTLNGVIVADNVAPVRWGNLGKYQIRAMKPEDIDLSDETMKFSNIICEWNWDSEEEKNFTQDIGKGSLKLHDAKTGFGNDYNNPYLPTEDMPNGYGTTNLKGLVNNGALQISNQWWDFKETLDGKYFDVQFSTSGVSGTNLVIGIAWGHGDTTSKTISAPSNWDVLYSTDGSAFNRLTTIKQRSCAWWSSPQTSQDACPGFTEHLVKLPGSCFGVNTVTVRFKAANTITDIAPPTSASTWRQAIGIEQGTITASTTVDQSVVRIGAITVRYN